MAALGRTIDGTQAPESSYDALPAGWYRARITEATQKPTSTGGTRLNVRFDLTSGAQGRVVYNGYNIRNANPKAEEISIRELQALANACGIGALTDDQQLVNRECEIKLTIKNDPERGPQNEVKGYKPASGGFAPGGAQTGSPFSPTAQSRTPVQSFGQPQNVGNASAASASPFTTSGAGSAPPWAAKPQGLAAELQDDIPF
jgi:hypothetical protein